MQNLFPRLRRNPKSSFSSSKGLTLFGIIMWRILLVVYYLNSISSILVCCRCKLSIKAMRRCLIIFCAFLYVSCCFLLISFRFIFLLFSYFYSWVRTCSMVVFVVSFFIFTFIFHIHTHTMPYYALPCHTNNKYTIYKHFLFICLYVCMNVYMYIWMFVFMNVKWLWISKECCNIVCGMMFCCSW